MSAIESVPFGVIPGDTTSSSSSDEGTPPPRVKRAASIKRAVITRSSTNEESSRSSGVPATGSTVATTPSPAAADATAEEEKSDRDGNLLIFDWDDTLCPSSWLSSKNLTLEEKCVIPEELKVPLARMAEFSIQTLTLAQALGTVIIVTNAEQGWIELSCRKFLPALYSHLQQYRHLSARTRYESQNANCPFTWKQLAFRDEIYAHFEHCVNPKKNVISLGDSIHERMAIISITRNVPVAGDGSMKLNGSIYELPPCAAFTKMMGRCRTKSVKFIERPTLDQLVQEHELIAKVLSDVVRYDDDLDLCIKPTSPSA